MVLNDLQKISGCDIPCQTLHLIFRQPRINDIALLGETDYFLAAQILARKIEYPGATTWDIFYSTCRQKIGGRYISPIMMNFFNLFTPYKAIILPKGIVFKDDNDKEITRIMADQFDLFILYINEIAGVKGLFKEEVYRPINKRAAAIAEKMKKVKEKKAKAKGAGGPAQQQQGLFNTFLECIPIVTAHTLHDVLNMTFYQIQMIFDRYVQYEKYETTLRTRLAGSTDKSKFAHWTESKENERIGSLNDL